MAVGVVLETLRLRRLVQGRFIRILIQRFQLLAVLQDPTTPIPAAVAAAAAEVVPQLLAEWVERAAPDQQAVKGPLESQAPRQ